MKVLILGGTGFMGSSIIKQRPQWDWTIVSSKDIDLTKQDTIDGQYDVIINAAGFYGGMVFNKIYQEQILYTNIEIANNVNRIVKRLKPKKFIQLGSACIYPDNAIGLIDESMIGSGKFHPGIMFSSLAKYYQLKSLYNLEVDWEYLVITNVYGPNEPLEYEKSHFVGALINKIKNSVDTVEMLGTGAAVRDFLYITDATEAICRFAELDRSTCAPTNISSGIGTSIKEVTSKLLEIVNDKKNLTWGSSEDNGVLYKVLDNKKMISNIDYTPVISLEEGLRQTWNFFN